jgi:hypothetical protein
MTINFPWGSLLRGVLGHDEIALAGLATLLAPAATATVLFSVIPRDGVPSRTSGSRTSTGGSASSSSSLAPRPRRRSPRRARAGPSACARVLPAR